MTSFNEGSIHNPFACHVLVHIINIKPSSTPQSLISPGLYAHTVSPPPLPSVSIFNSLAIWISSCSFLFYCTCLLRSHSWWLACKQFLLHVAEMKRASHENGFMSSSDISIYSEHGCWCLGKAWDVGLQPGHVSVSDLSTWPLIGICSVYLLADF